MSPIESARKFQFIREIASGGFGRVYLAKIIHSDGFSRVCAVKLLHRKWSENDEVASRMRDEARLLGWLRHRNIVEVMDLTLIEGRCAVVMEYLEAVDARLIVDRTRDLSNRVPLRASVQIAAAISAALDAAYNLPPYAGEKPLHVIHRDIKPSNVMVDEHGVVKVLDFGVARVEFDEREARTAELSFGSLEYMPPERLFFEPESPASDVYSVGTTLYELLTLEKLGKAKLRRTEQDAFLEERLDDLLTIHRPPTDEAAATLVTLLQQMLAFDADDRPSSAECVTRLRELAQSLAQPTVEEWAAANIEALIDHARQREEEDGATLVGRTIAEDVLGFVDDTTQRADEDMARAAGVYAEDGPTDIDPTEFDTAPGRTDTGLEDERWSALKQATLASLCETSELSPQTIEEVRRLAEETAPVLLLDDTAPESLDEDVMPTVRIHAPRRTADFESTTAQLDEVSLVAPRNLFNEETLRMSCEQARGETPPSRPVGPTLAPALAPAPMGYPELANEPDGGGGLLGVAIGAATLAALAGIAVLLLLLVVVVGGAWVLRGTAPVAPVSATAPGSARHAGLPSRTSPAPVAAVVPAPPVPVSDRAPDPSPAPAAAPTRGADDPLPASGAPVALFVSRLAGTRKMKVQCDHATADGVDEVSLPGTELGGCTVTAIDGSRRRQTAVVPAVEARRYVCFDGDARDCH